MCDAEFGTRYTKTSCIVYCVYRYIHDPNFLIHDKYTIILGLQLRIAVPLFRFEVLMCNTLCKLSVIVKWKIDEVVNRV